MNICVVKWIYEIRTGGTAQKINVAYDKGRKTCIRMVSDHVGIKIAARKKAVDQWAECQWVHD